MKKTLLTLACLSLLILVPACKPKKKAPVKKPVKKETVKKVKKAPTKAKKIAPVSPMKEKK
ncbi:hypothetical protein E3J79_03390 [Candidatus Dependentiae bacterium]|nr:MAG: hypothetical protein E3J79_03390 [Candidatus Dependentiae bacterium]